MRLFFCITVLAYAGAGLAVVGAATILLAIFDRPLQSSVAQSTPCVKGANQ